VSTGESATFTLKEIEGLGEAGSRKDHGGVPSEFGGLSAEYQQPTFARVYAERGHWNRGRGWRVSIARRARRERESDASRATRWLPGSVALAIEPIDVMRCDAMRRDALRRDRLRWRCETSRRTSRVRFAVTQAGRRRGPRGETVARDERRGRVLG